MSIQRRGAQENGERFDFTIDGPALRRRGLKNPGIHGGNMILRRRKVSVEEHAFCRLVTRPMRADAIVETKKQMVVRHKATDWDRFTMT